MAPRKRLYKLEDAVEMVFADSPSDDGDLLQPQSDPDYEFRERPVSNDFWITAINICLIRATTCIRSAYSCPRAINIQATLPDVCTTAQQKKRESIEKSCKSQEAWPRWVFLFQNDRGRTRVAQQRGEGPNTRATEVHASQVPGLALDTTAPWSPLQLFRLFFSHAVVHTIIANTNTHALNRLQGGKKYPWKVLTFKDFYIFLDAEVDSSDSEADSWRDEEEYDHRIDPFEDKKMREGMHKPLSPSVGLLQPRVARGCSFQKKGQTNASPPDKRRGRGKGKKTSLTPEEPGAVWNGPEVPDTAQQLPHFCPKRAPGVQGFVGVEYTPAQIFRHFFNNQAVNIICKNTNKNAEKEQAKGKKFVWEELKPVKFLMYVGLDVHGTPKTAKSKRLLEEGITLSVFSFLLLS
ncbi:hypothetical protein F7725_026827 [Dissostichus mawsoni]|uniref:Uncharacterized protein n=1 Tax=Dissostichus mawsoni TaxID=36200 RepID=A0A7J5X846_DISMA|nr:hypothetical protein F7725_026827 [Dissostichus mawsoni]